MPIKINHRTSEFSNSPVPMPSLISSEVCQMFLDPAHGGVWIINLDGITTYANASMAQMIGYMREELIGKNYLDFLDCEGRRIASQNLEQRKNGKSASHKFCLKHRNGSEVWVLIAANPIRDQSGTIMGAAAFITEIGEIDLATGNSAKVDRSEKSVRQETIIIERGNLSLDPDTFEVLVNGRSIELSAFSFKLLRYFMENTNRLIPRQEFLEKVWENPTLDDRVIDTHIVSLRKKLRRYSGEIKTIYGLGYIFKTPPREMK